MYTLRLTKVPENGTLTESGLHLGLEELGLAEPFDAAGVDVDFELTRMMERVFGQVHAEATVHLSCGRCLKDFTAPVFVNVHMQFEPGANGAAATADGDGEDLSDEDPHKVVAFIRGEELALGEELRQELELQVPFAPLCKPDCRGLCVVCGQDLNVADCGHEQIQGGGHFDALKNIGTKE